ncbi:MAG TPA: HSP90 family protein [Dermatophilaceae bacterium]|nr:HSP90 family protein [Dermatophilaceae bacterium]
MSDSREQFKVDLRGIVDILSHHLYSSERVYLRELLQNARDAIEARIRLEPDVKGEILITPAYGNEPMIVRDNGIGLSADDMRQLLATIGSSSKRKDFNAARRKFLGQFGIGLLSCFLIADTIEVRSRSAKEADAPTIKWVGHANGTFDIEECEPLDTPGSEMRIKPRHGEGWWCSEETLLQLTHDFAELLDVPVRVAGQLVSQRTAPWQLPVEEQVAWCRENLGFEPMGIIQLNVSMLDVKGLGFVLPYTAQPGHRTGDRIYARGMLVADADTQLLPDWAFFCRAVLDAGDLPLTASREALQETTSLRLVREQLGQRILAELILVHGAYPEVYYDIARLHSAGLKALSVEDRDLRDLVVSTLTFPTTAGDRTLVDLSRTGDPIHYITDGDKYAAMADIAAHTGALVVNASGPHDGALMKKLAESGQPLHEVDIDALVGMIKPTPASDRRAAMRLAASAVEILQKHDVTDVDVQVSSFEPVERAALWWPTMARFDDEKGKQSQSAKLATLVLNSANPAVEALMENSLTDEAVDQAVCALLVSAMLQGRAPVSPERATLLARSLQGLIGVVRTASIHELEAAAV